MGRLLIDDNINTILKILFKKINLKYTSSILSSAKEHPDFPSFMAFKHLFNKIGVDTVALKSDIQQLRYDLPKPALVHVTTNTDIFLIVDAVDDDNIYILNEKGETEVEPINSFNRMWGGNVMIFDTENIKEVNIPFVNRINTLLENLKKPLIFFSSLLLFVYLIHINNQLRSIYNYLFILISTIGIIFSALLELEVFDEHNPLLKKICTSGKNKNVNCSTILSSKEAYFLGLFSWSDIGFVYFSFMFLLNTIFPTEQTAMLSILLSLVCFPYVFYSLIYQKFIAKSWCRLCLGVQAVLTALFMLSLTKLNSINIIALINIDYIIKASILLITIISIFIITKSLVQKSYILKQTNSSHSNLKHNSLVKEAVLNNQRSVTQTTSSCIVLGNPNGETCITVVISPVCNPCMNELNTLIPILKNKTNTRIEILLLCDKEEDNPFVFNLCIKLIQHYLLNSNQFFDTLSNYVTNYPVSKFKLEKELFEASSYEARGILMEQIKWCVSNKLFSTPQILINSKKLPSYYTIKDVDYLCD